LNQLHSYGLEMQWIIPTHIHCFLPFDICLTDLWKAKALSTTTSNAVVVIRASPFGFLTVHDFWAVPRDVSDLVALTAHLLLVWWACLLGKACHRQSMGKILNMSLSGSIVSSAIGQHHDGCGHISRAHILAEDTVDVQLINCCVAVGLVRSSKEQTFWVLIASRLLIPGIVIFMTRGNTTFPTQLQRLQLVVRTSHHAHWDFHSVFPCGLFHPKSGSATAWWQTCSWLRQRCRQVPWSCLTARWHCWHPQVSQVQLTVLKVCLSSRANIGSWWSQTT